MKNKSSAFGGISRALSNRNYRIYWFGNTPSLLGFWIQKVGLGHLVWDLTGSYAWLGMIGFAALAPSVLLSPIAGAVADRYGLRLVAINALIVSGLAGLAFGLLVLTDNQKAEYLLILAFIQGLALSFDLPVRMALVPNLVERRDLSSAIALNTTTFHAGMFVGPALFGVIFSFFGLAAVFIVNGLTFFWFMSMLLLLRLEPVPKRGADAQTLFADMAEGVKYIASHPSMRALFLFAVVPHLFIRPYMEWMPGFSAEVFGHGAEGLASLFSATGLGSTLGGLWLALRGRNTGLTKILVVSLGVAILALLFFVFNNVYWIGLAIMFVLGITLVCGAVANHCLVQNTVEPSVRGRVISLGTGMAVGFPAIGALTFGWLGSAISIEISITGAMVIALLYWVPAAKRIMGRATDLEGEYHG